MVEKVYPIRVGRGDFWFSVLGAAVLVLGGCLFIVILAAPGVIGARGPDTLAGKLFFGIVCVGMAALAGCGLHYLVATPGTRWTVGADQVTLTRWYGQWTIALGQVVSARWGQNGLTLRTAKTRLRVDLSEFGGEPRRELIQFFRFRLPEETQTGWDAFWKMNWSCFEPSSTSDTTSPEYLEERAAFLRRTNRVILIGGLAWAVTLTWVAPWIGWSQVLRLAAGGVGVFVVFWFVMRRMPTFVPGEGSIRHRLPYPANDSKWPLLIWVVTVSLGSMPLLKAFGYAALGEVVPVVLLVPAAVVFVIEIPRQTRRIEAWRTEAARLAAELYLRPPEDSSEPS